MTNGLSTRFPRISTIDAVYRPVEGFQRRFAEWRGDPRLLGPLDAYLLHLVLEFAARPCMVVDQAWSVTEGASTLICLANGSANQVVVPAVTAGRPLSRSRLAEDLAQFAEEMEGGARSKLKTLAKTNAEWEGADALDTSGAWPIVIVAVDRDDWDPGPMISRLNDHPRTILVVLNLGRTGECESLRRLVTLCQGTAIYRPWLVRELAPSLHNSRIAIVARRDQEVGPNIIERIAHLFTNNFDFLTLVRDASLRPVHKVAVAESERQIQDLNQQAQEMKLWIAELDKQHRHLDKQVNELVCERDQFLRRHGQLTHQHRLLIHAHDHLAHERDHLCQALGESERLLHHECTRPLGRTILLQTGRRFAQLGRRHRALLAPGGSLRERLARSLMRLQRSLRGRNAPRPHTA